MTSQAQPVPFDPREQRVFPMPPPIDYPETPETLLAAKIQQRKDRAEVIAEIGDVAFERTRDACMLIESLCDEFGADRVHEWVRKARLIRGTNCSCTPRVPR